MWDGIGALIKRTVRQDIIDGGLVMQDAKDVAEHVKKRFGPEWAEAHMHGTLNEIIVSYTDTKEIEATRTTQEYTTLEGITKTYTFMALGEGGRLAQRQFADWCEACMHASSPGEGTLCTNLSCTGCTSPQS